MSDEPEPSEAERERNGGVSLTSSGDVSVGGDVAGRDVIRSTTQIGFSEKAVQRLLITVGVMVFATAACFFSGGVVVGAVAFNAFDRPVDSSSEAAQRMQNRVQFIQQLPAGTEFDLGFTEEELSSWVRFTIGEQIGFAPGTGRARILSADQLAIEGRLVEAGNVLVRATLRLTRDPERPAKFEAVAVQVLDTNSQFGWVAVPTAVVQPLETRLADLLGGVRLTSTAQLPETPQGPALVVSGVRR